MKKYIAFLLAVSGLAVGCQSIKGVFQTESCSSYILRRTVELEDAGYKLINSGTVDGKEGVFSYGVFGNPSTRDVVIDGFTNTEEALKLLKSDGAKETGKCEDRSGNTWFTVFADDLAEDESSSEAI